MRATVIGTAAHPLGPFARLPDLGPPRDGRGGLVRWTASAVVALGLHGAVVLPIVGRDDPTAAPDAPEAMVMIDLPPELALPPAESVESLAAPEVAADGATPVPADVPPEVAEAPPETVETLPDAAEAAVEPPAEEPPPVEPQETAVAEAVPEITETPPEAVPPDAVPEVAEVVETPPAEVVEPVAEVAEAAPEEVTAEEAVPPVPAKIPPKRPRRPEPTRTAERKPRPEKPRPQAEAPKRSVAAVESQAASGAGAPDPNALARFLSSVRADIMRQRRTVSVDGRGKTAVVRFEITASGDLSAIGIARTSGDGRLDDAALALVRRASPVPAIPGGVGRSSIRTTLPIRFD